MSPKKSWSMEQLLIFVNATQILTIATIIIIIIVYYTPPTILQSTK